MALDTPRASLRLPSLDKAAVWIVLVVLLLLAGLASDAFFKINYLTNLVRQAAPVGITAVGVTFVMLLRGVDLSVGAIVSMSAVVCALVMDGKAENLWLGIAAASACGAAIGLANGLLIAHGKVSAFILTLGMSIVVYGLVQMGTGGTARGIVSPGFREVLNSRVGGVLPVLVIFLLVAMAIGIFLQSRTRFGRSVYLIGANPDAARLAGLPVNRVTVIAYVVSGFFAGLGGLALLARTGVSGTNPGAGMEFDVLAAVVLGGTTFAGGRGSVGATFAGVMVLFIALNLANVAGLPYAAQLTIKGLIIIAASAAHSWIGWRVSARTQQ
ncbi:ABC transporter permease [Pseudaminobacter sp. 19-2017]|uniref:ABC transporter permease n=1 Tax=Pseudaminobacter soli (ex Zhang et al. 2022) TaxID=2831468 RepID=A0A942I4M8_9HYPH|nr:ABC transporter permease [Pseudaminobacter soli]MBS3651724.1 ABC transporter permease [Pseudaminobacter soli]